jgi:signal transduction histidine kinase
MADPGSAETWLPPLLRRVVRLACAVMLALTTAALVHGMLRQSPSLIAVTAAALLVVLGGIGRGFATRTADLDTLLPVGLAAAVLVGLLPDTPGYLVIYGVVVVLGMNVAPRPALAAGVAIFATANFAFLLARLPLTTLVGNDLGMAFLFQFGVSTRSMRISHARALAAQARAEDLLAQLRASQAAQTEAAALTERTRLAREIHDILAHSMAGLVLALDTAELLGRPAPAGQETDRAGTEAKILAQVTRAQHIARQGLAETRRAVAALRGDEIPGPALLDRLVRETSEATGIYAALTVTGQQRPLSPEAGLALYRTAQEALINTAKYAGRGGHAELHVSYGARDVALMIEDTRGPDTAAPAPAGLTFGGYGLTGMRERAELLGGRLTAGPTDEGFRVLLWLPASPVPALAQAGSGR